MPCLAVIAVLLMVDTGYWVLKYENEVRQRFEENIENATVTIADASSEAVWQFDRQTAQRTLQNFNEMSGFLSAAIYDLTGEFASFKSSAGQSTSLASLNQEQALGFRQVGDVYYFSTVVSRKGEEELGRLVAAFDATPMRNELRQARVNALIFAAIIFVTVMALLSFVARSVTMPLTRITRAIEKVAEGELYLEIPERSGTKEVARLANALSVFQRNAVSLVAAKAEAAANRRVADLAMIDDLTGLANRRALDGLFDKLNKASRQEGTLHTVLHLDLDGFKQINDTVGHKAGDHVIQQVAKRLDLFSGDCALVARIGGDEFVLLLDPHVAGSADPEDLALTVIKSVTMPIIYEEQKLRVGASIGIASQIDTTETMSQTLVHADVALYRAKARGKGCAVVFDSEQRDALHERKRMSEEILQGINRNEFVPFFQPILDAVSGEIVSVEMLARWNHPDEGVLAPARFLSIATDLNMMRLIDKQVLDVALDTFDAWQSEGLEVPRLSINASISRLMEPDLSETIVEACAVGIKIDLELLESIFLDEPPPQVLWQLDRLREIGCNLHIDDFGTGHASVAGLLQVGPDKVKIDRQFVIPAPHNVKARGLVELIVGICAQLDIDAVAEGVETLDHARLMSDLGCKFLQGHAFYTPMNAVALEKVLRAQSGGQAAIAG